MPNLELAVDGCLWGGFGTSGQRCTAASRVVVHEKVYKQFVDAFVARASALRRRRRPARHDGDGAVEQSTAARHGDALRDRSVATKARGSRAAAVGSTTACTPKGSSTSRPCSPTSTRRCGSRARRSSDRWSRSSRASPSRKRSRSATASSTACRHRSTPRTSIAPSQAMRDLYTGIFYVNAPTIGAEVHLPVRRDQEHRQRSPRGWRRRARRLLGMEVGLHRLQRQAPACTD